VYAATDKGVFKLIRNESLSAGMQALQVDVDQYFVSEPSIRDVHQMAIEYARVNPRKIASWENQAQKKAWMPKLSMGLDSDRNKTLSDNIYGSYTGGGQSYIGPRDKTFYSNFGWDVSLSWDLGELIWNPDQTSIDSRSKLMSELREDILNEVTRIYFERRRLQIETLKGSAQYDEFCLEKKMRIEELTALIDALTGGRFSEEIEKNRE
jgi:outer membrane protein TolC